MSIAHFSVNRPVTVIMRIAALVLLGVICLTRLPVDLLPKVSLPTISVSTSWPNVAPEEIESQVTRPIEQALSSVTNLYAINSTTDEGSSSVRVQFQWGTDIGQATVEVLQLVERAKRNFPNDDTLQMPLVFKFDPNQTPIRIYGVSGENDPVKLRTLLDNQVSPIIESADGVAAATVTGGQQRAVIVDINPIQLQAYHLAIADVIRRLMQENLNLPAGIAKQGNTEYTVRSLGWFISTKDIANIPLTAPNGQIVKLGDVAQVRDEHQETRSYIRLNGETSAGIIVTKQSGANTVSTAQAVEDRIKRVEKIYPNLHFGLAYDQAGYIQNSIDDVKTNALLGGVLAILILLFFLRNVRSTLVVALSIPTSIFSTFALLYLCGFTLNTMSLGGLALATGLIVDDAVVVLENIFRHIERDKKTPREAAISGTDEIVSAVVASTWTVMVVFLPLLLIKGQAGQMFTQFALVVIFSLAVSLLDATTVVPMLANYLISGDAHSEMLDAGAEHRSLLLRAFSQFGRWFTALDNNYRRILAWALHHRWMVLGGALGITLLSLLLLPQLGTELMPQTDSGDFQVSVKMPPGTAVDKTNEAMLGVEKILKDTPEVETAFAAAGTNLSMRGGGTSLNNNEGSVMVRLKRERKKTTQDVIADLRKKFGRLPGIRPRINQFDLVTSMMTGGNPSVEVDIFGDDLTTLSDRAQEVIQLVKGIPGYENVDVNWQESSPEIQWKVDREKAAELGVSFADIANTINTATNGSTATYYQEKGFQYPIIVQLPPADRKTVAAMSSLVITPSTPGAKAVLLSQVAKPVYDMGPSEITRQDRQRYIAVQGTPQGRSAGEIQKDVEKALANLQLPTGYYWDWGLNQKRQVDEFSGMWLAVFLAIALIYMLLASQFESLIHPLTVLCSVPMAITGVILALFLTNRSFGLTAFIGVLMLVGIVVKNGILLVDYTNVLRKRGLERDNAILNAAPTRLRPILMTASAAILGMFPIALALGKGSEIQAPMATAVIGGLTTSTMLTLLVVPLVYTVFDDLAGLFQKKHVVEELPQLEEVAHD